MPLKWLAALLSVATIFGFYQPATAVAAHDHDHIYVTMVDYLGYDKDSQHYVIKVKRIVDGDPIYYYVHFLENASSLRGHEGERMQVSLSGEGNAWSRLSFGNHGTWRIHEVARARAR